MARCKKNKYEFILKVNDQEYIFRKEDARKVFIKEFCITNAIMYSRDKNDGAICNRREIRHIRMCNN